MATTNISAKKSVFLLGLFIWFNFNTDWDLNSAQNKPFSSVILIEQNQRNKTSIICNSNQFHG